MSGIGIKIRVFMVDWINAVEIRDKWQDHVKRAMNCVSPWNAGNFLT